MSCPGVHGKLRQIVKGPTFRSGTHGCGAQTPSSSTGLAFFSGARVVGNFSYPKNPWDVMESKTPLGGGNSNIFVDFHPYLGKIPILTNIFKAVETTN